jgi:hypothetical protein
VVEELVRECIGEEGHKLFIEEGGDVDEADEEDMPSHRADDSIEDMDLEEEKSHSEHSNQSPSFDDGEEEFEDDFSSFSIDSQNEL